MYFCKQFIGEGAFKNCQNIPSITIPSQLKNIDKETFLGCSAAQSLLIQASPVSPSQNETKLKYIGNSAFKNCSSLEKISIPRGVETIDCNAFQDCTSATSLNIPLSVTNLLDGSFAGCTSLPYVKIPSSLSGDRAWAGGSFAGCTSLKTVEIEEGVSRIGDSTFYGCTSLEKINFPGSLGTADYPGNIGAHAFENCTSLQSIVVDEGVRHIADSAFEGCSNLRNVTLPSTISNNPDKKGIGSRAFYYGTTGIGGLVNITIYAPLPPTIGENVFKVWQGLSPTTTVAFYPNIYVPSDSYDNYTQANGWSNYSDRIKRL